MTAPARPAARRLTLGLDRGSFPVTVARCRMDRADASRRASSAAWGRTVRPPNRSNAPESPPPGGAAR